MTADRTLVQILDDAILTGSVSTTSVEHAVLSSVEVERLEGELARRGVLLLRQETLPSEEKIAQLISDREQLRSLLVSCRAHLERVRYHVRGERALDLEALLRELAGKLGPELVVVGGPAQRCPECGGSLKWHATDTSVLVGGSVRRAWADCEAGPNVSRRADRMHCGEPSCSWQGAAVVWDQGRQELRWAR